MGKKPAVLIFYLLPEIFILLLAGPGCDCRPITVDSSSGVISDGVNNIYQWQSSKDLIDLNSRLININISSESSCSETYGFLPCTSSILGNVFLILVYGYMMFMGAKLLSEGSEILLQILGPGLIGGFLLPVLSSLPDAAIILASGLSGSKETAQSQVSVGMGLLAGSTVLLLTLLWGSCLIVGKCDLLNSVAVDHQDSKPFSLKGSGVSTDIWTCYAARIMIISVIPLVIVQLPELLQIDSLSSLAVLVSLIFSISLFIAYCFYQVFQPWIQKRKIAYAKHKFFMSEMLQHLKSHTLGNFLTDDGQPNKQVIQKLFKTLDQNSDGYLSCSEIRALIIGMKFDKLDMNVDNAVDNLIKDFDSSQDQHIDENEFVEGISRWLNRVKRSGIILDRRKTLELLTEFHQKTEKEQDGLEDKNEESVESVENQKWKFTKAILMLIFGTVIAAVVSDPIVDAVDNFSTATSIPTFFVSFVILPFASSSEIVSTLMFSSQKCLKTSSLTYSEIYGSVTMTNLLSLSVFLGLVYFRGLTWSFSSEVLVVVIVCVVMGLIASVRTTFPLWICFLACVLYPLSVLLVYILNYIVGWS